jgi:hypothetical protein
LPSVDLLKARSIALTCGVLSSWRHSSIIHEHELPINRRQLVFECLIIA